MQHILDLIYCYCLLSIEDKQNGCTYFMRIHHFFIHSPLCFILIFMHFHVLSRDIYDSIHTINRKLKKNVSKTQLPKDIFTRKTPLRCQFTTVAVNELLCLKNAGAQISLFFTSYE